MIGLIATLLLSQIPALANVKLDPVRLEAELAADVDVIASLEKNRDDASIARPVDVRFVGQKSNLEKLASALSKGGWMIIQMIPAGDGLYALDTSHKQTTEGGPLRELTETSLRIESVFNVRYDGWGTVAKTGKEK
ncbi:MAG: ribonuclease E inhibitor RraB [Sphingobium sp.]|nr:ribonuclease E inhibitor RraB [Sphingobium sp.]